ncbi:hypothetical protein, partial [Aliivibrio kagoshimensis]|uniref:hypothetical protein n=1 Tax=Aliivibrio kagoshimensis TaxID=2910230 RepID=UPI003D0ABB1F
MNFDTEFDSKLAYKSKLKYLRTKEEKYIAGLIPVLNEIHNTTLSDAFWRKALSMGFRRYVHISYDQYLHHKKNFNKNISFTKMSLTDYKFIADFDGFRNYYTHDINGYNQMFSLFIDCFYKDIKPDNKYLFNKKEKEKEKEKGFYSGFFLKAKRKILNITFDKLLLRVLKLIYT